MDILKEISGCTRQWKPRIRQYEGRWVCYSDYPMKLAAGYGRTYMDAFEAWLRAYPDLLLNLRR